jgi:arylsulfatase A-like enzyme
MPRRTGLGSVVEIFTDAFALDDRETTLPEALLAAPTPYTSGGFGKWHLVVQREPEFLDSPYRHGFGWWQGTLDNLHVSVFAYGIAPSYTHFEYLQNGNLSWNDAFAVTVAVDDALAFARAAPEPWFTYVALHAAHTPLSAPPQELVPSHTVPAEQVDPNDWYAPMVEAADTEIGRLLDGLGPDLLARTNVFVLSDNGTPDDRIVAPYDPERAKLSLFDGGTRVPLVVAGPAVAVPGLDSDAHVSVVDLLPTVLEAAGAAPAALPIDGVSILPLLRGDATATRTSVYAEQFSPNGDPALATSDNRVIRDAGYKLISSREGEQRFFAYAPGAVDEGPDLLASGTPLTAEQDAAFLRLQAEMDAAVADMTYDWGT